MEPVPEQQPASQPPPFSTSTGELPLSSGVQPPRLRLWVTVLFGIVLLGLLTVMYFDTISDPMADLLDAPEYLQRVASRELDGDEYLRVAPVWYRSLATVMGAGPDNHERIPSARWSDISIRPIPWCSVNPLWSCSGKPGAFKMCTST